MLEEQGTLGVSVISTNSLTPFILLSFAYSKLTFSSPLRRNSGLSWVLRLLDWILKERSDAFKLEVFDLFPQMVTFRCYTSTNSWVATVYTSPIPTMRELLWDHIRTLQGNIHSLWALLEDFNEVIKCAALEVLLHGLETLQGRSFSLLA
ncbi:hypothetical protein VNO78_34364 [Psophocarpus tetragonolobus]|uniref:Uncharacterized protein n=1 Tax=Psophocarpus tetragonolobus TaxID=3891 RepID=A0AAN9NW43_PSOTE